MNGTVVCEKSSFFIFVVTDYKCIVGFHDGNRGHIDNRGNWFCRGWNVGSVCGIFIFWMIFLDTHSLKTHFNLNKEIDELENQKENISKMIEEDNASIKKLKKIDSLESFARENYGYKKENETIYIIETN